MFAVIREEGPAEGLFKKDPAPPPPETQNSTTSPSAPGNPIEAGISNDSNGAEDIALVRNQGMKVNNDIEPSP